MVDTNEIVFIGMITVGIIVLIATVIIAASWTDFDWYIWIAIGFGGLILVGGIVGLILHYINQKNMVDESQIKQTNVVDDNMNSRGNCFNRYLDTIDTSNLSVQCITGEIQKVYDNKIAGCPNLGTDFCADPDKTASIKEARKLSTTTMVPIKTVKASDIMDLTPV